MFNPSRWRPSLVSMFHLIYFHVVIHLYSFPSFPCATIKEPIERWFETIEKALLICWTIAFNQAHSSFRTWIWFFFWNNMLIITTFWESYRLNSWVLVVTNKWMCYCTFDKVLVMSHEPPKFLDVTWDERQHG